MREHVYVDTLKSPGTAVNVVHVIPVTPTIDQLAVPVGVAPDTGPVTVAVNVICEPRAAVGALVVTEIAGVNLETVIVAE